MKCRTGGFFHDDACVRLVMTAVDDEQGTVDALHEDGTQESGVTCQKRRMLLDQQNYVQAAHSNSIGALQKMARGSEGKQRRKAERKEARGYICQKRYKGKGRINNHTKAMSNVSRRRANWRLFLVPT